MFTITMAEALQNPGGDVPGLAPGKVLFWSARWEDDKDAPVILGIGDDEDEAFANAERFVVADGIDDLSEDDGFFTLVTT